MSENHVEHEHQIPKIASTAMYLGLASLVVLLASVVLGFLVDSLGIVSFFGVVALLAGAAIVCAVLAGNKITAAKLPGRRTAQTGLILGIVTLLLTIFLRILVFLFFIPWLGA